MPVIVGASGTGTEGKADRLGLATGTSDPGSAAAGDMYYKTDTKKIRIYDGSAWNDLASGAASGGAQPTDGGGGGGTQHDVSNSANGIGFTNSSQTRYFNFAHDAAGTNYDPWFWRAGATSGFHWHCGHSGANVFPLMCAIQVDATTPRVLNECEWVKHSNACGNVDFYGSNQAIDSNNFTDLANWTFLGRGHMGGSGSEGDGTHKFGHFNHWGWGYRWYMVSVRDAAGNEAHGPVWDGVGNYQGGWAMYGCRLNKIEDYINDGYMSADAFSDNSCKAHYKFESNFLDETGGPTAVGGGGGVAGVASNISGNCYEGNGASYFHTPNTSSPVISDYMAGPTPWGVSLWFKMHPSATANNSFFHCSKDNDHDRPGAWLRRIDGSNYQCEYFASSTGSSWNICKGDVGTSTDARGNLIGISQDVWHHWVWTRSDSGQYRGWVDGLLDFHYDNNTSLYGSGAPATVWGNWFHSANGYGFYGQLDNVRYFNKFLTQDDVAALYLRHS